MCIQEIANFYQEENKFSSRRKNIFIKEKKKFYQEEKKVSSGRKKAPFIYRLRIGKIVVKKFHVRIVKIPGECHLYFCL